MVGCRYYKSGPRYKASSAQRGRQAGNGKRRPRHGRLMKLKDLTGQRFGRLEVISRAENKTKPCGQHSACWNCKCSCGIIKTIRSSELTTGNTQSCGCLRNERVRKALSKGPFTSLYENVRRRAKESNREVELTFDEFLEFTKIPLCHYCEDTVTWSPFKQTNESVRYNLDRKDNNKSYSKDNCVVCCTRCNMAKKDLFTYEEWVEHGKLIKAMRENKEKNGNRVDGIEQ